MLESKTEITSRGAEFERAIQRWEGEGGLALLPEESLSGRLRDLPRSPPEDGSSRGVSAPGADRRR